jgi:hypothetical protein
MIQYKLTSKYALYYDGKAEILNEGDVFNLAGLELSKHTSNSPFHYKGDIIRLPNCMLEKIL